MVKMNPDKKNKKGFHHFFGKYSIFAHISYLILFIFPYPGKLSEPFFSIYLFIFFTLFISSIVAIALENILEKEPYNFGKPRNFVDVEELESIIDQLRNSPDNNEQKSV